jgi:hypothetical protein
MILNKYVNDNHRLLVSLTVASGVGAQTLKRLIEDGIKAATALFVNEVVADQATMLALTDIPTSYRVYQTDDKVFWKLTGADPTDIADWTAYGVSVADETERLALAAGVLTGSTVEVGLIVFQEDTEVWYNYIGVPDDITANDATVAAQWLAISEEPSFSQFLYAYLGNLSWKLHPDSWIRIRTAAIDVKILTAFVRSDDGESPYAASTVSTYGSLIVDDDGWVQIGIGDPQLLVIYANNTYEISLNLGFERG